MKLSRFLFALLLIVFCKFGYGQDTAEIIRQSRAFIQKKEYAKATELLKTAIEDNNNILSYKKELFWSYYLQDRYTEALNQIVLVLQSEQKDEQCYQLCANVYRAQGQYKSCDSLLKLGLKLYPTSGPLYNDLGENARDLKKPEEAILYWEKGIETDADFSGNYFNAALYYLDKRQTIWGILYGEIFVNFAPRGEKSVLIRKQLLETYKTLFLQMKKCKTSEFETPFAKKYITHLYKQEELSRKSMSIDDLMMIRTRFLLDWYQDRSVVLPFRLFERQRYLLQNGLYSAYHQWLFGSVEDAATYQRWKTLHSEEDAAFTLYQQNVLFHIPYGQYYRNN